MLNIPWDLSVGHPGGLPAALGGGPQQRAAAARERQAGAGAHADAPARPEDGGAKRSG